MGRKLTGNPPGPVPKPIDWDLFEQYCGLLCTQEEMAALLKINIDTLRDRAQEHYGEEYSNIYKRFSSTGKCSLRRNQFAMSKKNASMAIFLGKNYLNQRDNPIEQSHPEEVMKQFGAMMQQLAAFQASLGVSSSNPQVVPQSDIVEVSE